MNNRPWLDAYGNVGAIYERDQFIHDYQSWIDQGLVSSTKVAVREVFQHFPEKIVFVPQTGLKGWGWTPLKVKVIDPRGNEVMKVHKLT